MQKEISGYHMLMILSVVDNRLAVDEDMVIRDWLIQEFPESKNMDDELEIISTMEPDEYLSHFHKHMDLFYKHSTPKERMDLLQFAMDLIQADGQIVREENQYFDLMYEAWSEENN